MSDDTYAKNTVICESRQHILISDFVRYGRKIAGLTSSSKDEVLEAARSWAAAMDEDGPILASSVQKQAEKPPASKGDTHRSRTSATDLSTPFELVNQLSGQPPLRIFVAGDRSKVGKSR